MIQCIFADKQPTNIFKEHNKRIQKSWPKKIDTSEDDPRIPNELSLYLRAPAEKIQQNPLDFWKQMMVTYPNIYKQAFKYLTTVATSVPSERLFSEVGLILNQQRNRLKGDILSKLIFLKDVDKKFWEFR